MNPVIALDRRLFVLINNGLQNSFFDSIMPVIRNSMTWVPLYLFLLIFVLVNFNKNKWWWILGVIVVAALSDVISSKLIKNSFFRLRPCNDPELAAKLHYIMPYKPQSSSFTSSHAFSHFALAAFFFYTLHKYMNKWTYLFFLWAFVICFAQVYIGVHFPGDVLSGGVFGFVFGYLLAKSFNKRYSLTNQTI